MKLKTFIHCSAFLALSLTACQTAEKPSHLSHTDRINAILEKAADEAQLRGNTAENLALLERVYKRNSNDPKAALKYARVLRHANRLQRASVVLTPFARDETLNNIDIKIEYAAIQAAMGNYGIAENSARQAVSITPENPRAQHMLGIALDAQGIHKEAEDSFRMALDHWEGDPTPIMNNLGLNLAAQGFLDEALNILRKASAAAPNRPEIERNLRIVTALLSGLPNSRSTHRIYNAAIPEPDHKPVLD